MNWWRYLATLSPDNDLVLCSLLTLTPPSASGYLQKPAFREIIAAEQRQWNRQQQSGHQRYVLRFLVCGAWLTCLIL